MKMTGKVFSANKERNCPICGLKMKWLSFQLWQCKCGYKKKGVKDVEEEGEEERDKRKRWRGEKKVRFRKTKQPPYRGVR